jgi:polysaccharide biosynthesis/export protein
MKFITHAFTQGLLFCVIFFFCSGCQTTPTAVVVPGPGVDENAAPTTAVTLREGDVLSITFPSTKQLDTAQQIRRDGKISIPVLGEVRAVGLTPSELEKQIVTQFGDQLVGKEVTVSIQSSIYPVFVNGAVLKPGKIEATRPITALEAIMEAGGFNYATANLKKVKIIRTRGSEVKTFMLDFGPILDGKPSVPFYVQPSDIIFVPEKFTLF